MPAMTLRNVLMPVPQWEAIRAEASRCELSASELIRLVLNGYLERTAPLRCERRQSARSSTQCRNNPTALAVTATLRPAKIRKVRIGSVLRRGVVRHNVPNPDFP